MSAELPLRLRPEGALGGLIEDDADAPLSDAVWYTAGEVGDGLAYRLPAGGLAGARYLTADMLLDGEDLAVFQLELADGPDGPVFQLVYSALNQCSARIRMPLDLVDQNRWRHPREGAWLKPMARGDRVDPRRVDRMRLTVLRKGPRPVRWCLTPFDATAEEPPALAEPLLPRGPLLDELGQSRLRDWPTRSRAADEVSGRLRAQARAAPAQRWPDGWSRWGGWQDRCFEASGFFRTERDGDGRWWLVDPGGCAFWSAGQDCVRVDTSAAYAGLEPALAWLPERDGDFAVAYRDSEGGTATVNYLAANLVRAFGAGDWHDRWAGIALGMLRRFGFNTVANWSEWDIARRAGFPYVRPLELRLRHTATVFRDFPDVFDPGFERDAAAFAGQLRDTLDDPALVGYFLMNEPTWGFAACTPAEGMLWTAGRCASRAALAEHLRVRYRDDAALAEAWGAGATFDAVAAGPWTAGLSEAARADLAGFSAVMVERLFDRLNRACRRVDPHHLNLGARYYTVPPDWALEGMRGFDVFSINVYRRPTPPEELGRVSERLGRPVLIGEWHFGALDVGLPGSGIGHVRDQGARGQAFRVYTEAAAAAPWCVGAHHFTLYDESALGRFDGENWNIGFLDVCNRPYEPLAAAARASHERLYRVRLGETAAYDDRPEYLPPLF